MKHQRQYSIVPAQMVGKVFIVKEKQIIVIILHAKRKVFAFHYYLITHAHVLAVILVGIVT
jgi:hypothetical protein